MERPNSDWMLRADAARYLGLSISALAHMACEGRGPRYYRAGKFTRYFKGDLDAWIRSRAVTPLPEKLQPFVRRCTTNRRL